MGSNIFHLYQPDSLVLHLPNRHLSRLALSQVAMMTIGTTFQLAIIRPIGPNRAKNLYFFQQILQFSLNGIGKPFSLFFRLG